MMEIFKELLNNSKISFYINNNIIYKVIIENFEPIKSFDDSFIIFEKYTLSGRKLKIEKMEENELEIQGEIESFKLN